MQPSHDELGRPEPLRVAGRRDLCSISIRIAADYLATFPCAQLAIDTDVDWRRVVRVTHVDRLLEEFDRPVAEQEVSSARMLAAEAKLAQRPVVKPDLEVQPGIGLPGRRESGRKEARVVQKEWRVHAGYRRSRAFDARGAWRGRAEPEIPRP